MWKILIIVLLTLGACTADKTSDRKADLSLVKNVVAMDTVKKIERSEEEWKKILTPEQYYILRQKGTDRPFTGALTYNKEEGTYYCAACGNELFTSDMKFESHCGWPSFDREVAGGRIKTVRDTSHGMIRTEILCARCDSHLGHLFDDGPTDTGLRYCVNSTSLEFRSSSKED